MYHSDVSVYPSSTPKKMYVRMKERVKMYFIILSILRQLNLNTNFVTHEHIGLIGTHYSNIHTLNLNAV